MSDTPSRPYIGRIIAMWKDTAGVCCGAAVVGVCNFRLCVTRLVGLCWIRVRWFYRKEDTSAAKGKVAPVGGTNALSDAEIAEKEVFASAAEDDNFLSTVDGVRLRLVQSSKAHSPSSDARVQVARLFKGDDVTDWAPVSSDPDAVFVRRMYK